MSYGYVSVSLLHLSLSAFAVFRVDRQFYVVDTPLLQWICNAVFSNGPAIDLEIVQHVMRRNIFVQKQLHIWCKKLHIHYEKTTYAKNTADPLKLTMTYQTQTQTVVVLHLLNLSSAATS